jgi:hypothetical protein
MTKSLFTLLLLVFALAIHAQGPPALISYQAVLRDTQGSIVSNQEVSLEFAIRQGDPTGVIVFEESHPMVNTSAYGVFGVQIGSGIPTGVGQFTSLDEIGWSQGSYFIEVRAVLPGQGAAEIIGVTQMLTVPYAMHAASADIVVNESDGSITNEILSDITFDGTNLIFHEGNNTFTYNVATLLALVSGDNDSNNELITGMYALDQNTLQINEGSNTSTGDVSAISYATWSESEEAVYNTTQMVGVGTPVPNSTLDVRGSQSVNFRLIEGDAGTPGPTVDQCNPNDYLLLCNITEEDVTVTLPDATVCPGRIYRFRKFSTAPSSYDVNVVPVSGQLIDGVNNFSMGWPLPEYLTVLSTGIGWMIVEHSKE